MNKSAFKKPFIFSVIALFFCVSTAAAQFKNAGKLNVWTTGNVQRIYGNEEGLEVLCRVRVAKNDSFDRIVFEFAAGKPDYIIQYLPSNIYTSDAGDEKIKIAGKRFLQITLYVAGAFENMPCEIEDAPEKKLNFPSILQIENAGWFEGIRDYIVGVSGKKPFRVRELTNPSRLVVDFKH